MSERRHEGRVAAITGGSGGIGRAIAGELCRHGARIALLDVDPGVVEVARTFDTDDDAVTGHRIDVADPDSVDCAFAGVRSAHGALHILVNCAGIVLRREGRKVSAIEMTPQEWQRTIDVNLTGVFLCSRAAVPMMREAGWGRIVSLSSQGGRTGGVFSSVDYGASKAGVIGLSRTLALEVGRYGVTVNCIAPGRVSTAMTEYESERDQNDAWLATLPVPRMATPDEIAAAVSFLTSAQAGYVTGATLDVNGGGFMA